MSYIDDLITLIKGDWNISSVPTIARINTLTRVNYRDSSYILVYEYDQLETKKGFRYEFVTHKNILSFDIRTKVDYHTLKMLEAELERILHNHRKAPISDFDVLNIIRRTDLSELSVRIYKTVIDIELIDKTKVI